MDEQKIKIIVEAALMAADSPLNVSALVKLFAPGEADEEQASKQVRTVLKALQTEAQERGVELKQVASGYRYQVRQDLSEWVSRLWDEKPPRYTRALLETLALVAYKQPVSRGDIEQVRGVSVSQSIMRTLIEREWIKVVGQREVPGRPSLYGTTKEFLDYFNLKSLDELPPLPEIRELIEPVLAVQNDVEAPAAGIEDQQQADTESGADALADDDIVVGGLAVGAPQDDGQFLPADQENEQKEEQATTQDFDQDLSADGLPVESADDEMQPATVVEVATNLDVDAELDAITEPDTDVVGEVTVHDVAKVDADTLNYQADYQADDQEGEQEGGQKADQDVDRKARESAEVVPLHRGGIPKS